MMIEACLAIEEQRVQRQYEAYKASARRRRRRRLVVGLAALSVCCALMIGLARAADVTVTLTEQEAQNWTLVGTVTDQCVAGIQLRGDPGPCRQLSGFLASFAEKVAQAAKPAPNPPEPEPKKAPPPR